MELTILMPCLNEARTLPECIRKANQFLNNYNISGEVLIADNGSTDDSAGIASSLGARVISAAPKGYGAAIIAGIGAAKGKYIIMGDADDSYDFSNLMPFIEKLREGYDLVMGNRFKGGIKENAMPWLHKYIGNPLLSFIGKLFFGSVCNDFHSGLRGFNAASMRAIGLRTTGMEFASEMVVKSTLKKLRITEVPIILSKDGRDRPPHLRSWRDGWRHLAFLLTFSPRWIFFYPSVFLLLVGFFMMIFLVRGPVIINQIMFDVHTLIISSVAMISGVQVLMFAFLARRYCVAHGIHPRDDQNYNVSGLLSLEGILIIGLAMLMFGTAGILYSISIWVNSHFGPMDYEYIMRLLVPSSTLCIIGLQSLFSAFLGNLISMSGSCE